MHAMIPTHSGPVAVELSAVAFPNEATQHCNIMVTVQRPDSAPTVSDEEFASHLRLRVPGVGEVGGRADTGSAGQLLFESDDSAVEPLPSVVEVLWCLQGAQILGTLYCGTLPAVPEQESASSDTTSNSPENRRQEPKVRKPWWKLW